MMGTGSWNKSQQYGDSPAMPDAFLKWYQGWISPVQAGTGNTYTLRPGESNPDALLVGRNPGGIDWGFYKQSGTGEYWLVENRQKDGYDAGLPGCGILVWHIDETVRNDNLANANRTRPLAALEEADGLGQLYRNDELSNRGDPGDPFPGTANNMTWGTGTSPDSAFYSGALSGHGLEVAAPGYNAANCQTMDIAVSYDGPVDTTSPTVTVNQAGDQPDPANNAPVLFTAVFSEPVTGFASDDILFAGSTAPGALSASVTGSGATYTIAVSGMTGSGNVVISIPASAAQDSQGNANTASISVDNTVLFEIIIKTFYLPVLSSLPSAPVLPAGYPRQAAR